MASFKIWKLPDKVTKNRHKIIMSTFENRHRNLVGKNRDPSLKQQDEEHIPQPIKNGERIPTVKGTGKDLIPPQYSTDEAQITPKTLGEDQILPRK